MCASLPSTSYEWGKKADLCIGTAACTQTHTHRHTHRRTHTHAHTQAVVALLCSSDCWRCLKGRWDELFHQIRTQQGGADFARSNECFNDSWKFVRGGIKKNENVSSARKSHLGLCSGGDGVNDLCLLLLCDLNRAGALSRLHGTTLLYFTLLYFSFVSGKAFKKIEEGETVWQLLAAEQGIHSQKPVTSVHLL